MLPQNTVSEGFYCIVKYFHAHSGWFVLHTALQLSGVREEVANGAWESDSKSFLLVSVEICVQQTVGGLTVH